MKVSIKVTDKGLEKIKKKLAKVAAEAPRVWAGLPNTPHGDGLSNAELGIIHEYGTSNIPARPFIGPSFKKNQSSYNKALVKMGSQILDTGNYDITPALDSVGKQMAADMKSFVTEGYVRPGNAPATIKAKGSDTPLIDTGRMVDAITHAVEKGK